MVKCTCCGKSTGNVLHYVNFTVTMCCNARALVLVHSVDEVDELITPTYIQRVGRSVRRICEEGEFMESEGNVVGIKTWRKK